MSEPSVVKSVRMPRDLVDGLQARADRERRTFNNLAVKLLAEALESSAPTHPADDKDSTA